MRPSRRPTILLTGFGPFPGVPINASWALVRRLAPVARRAFPAYAVIAAQLPTEWHSGTRRLIDLLAETRPDLALHFGVSRKATGFVVETRGYNRRSAVADACGATPAAGECLVADAPDILSAQLPAAHIAHRLRALGLPVEISRDAGRYLCNAALFHTLDAARNHSGRRSGFIHLPVNIGQRQRHGRSQLTMPRAIEGGIAIISTCLGVAPAAAALSATDGLPRPYAGIAAPPAAP